MSKPTRKPTPAKASPTKKAAAAKPAAKKSAKAAKPAKAATPTDAAAGPTFTRLLVKLLVMDHLMRQGVVPPFSLKTVEKAAGKKLYVDGNWVMPDGDYFGMQPEIRDWFFHHPVRAEWLADIRELEWLGHDIIQHVAPNWDGEDGLFDLTAADAADLPLLPNLRVLRAWVQDSDAPVVAAFAKHGVAFEPPSA